MSFELAGLLCVSTAKTLLVGRRSDFNNEVEMKNESG